MPGDASGAQKTAQLGEVSMPRLLFALLRNRFTGTLRLQQPEPAGERTIWVRGGMPVFTDWDSPPDVLGEVLVARGVIDHQVLMAALGEMASGAGLLGEILVGQGAIDTKQLTEGLREQCLRKLLHTFALRDGAVEIAAEDHDRGKDDGLTQVNVLELVRKGVSRHYDVDRVRGEMGPQYLARLATTTTFERYRAHFKFRPDDEPALQALASGAAVADLAGLPGLSEARAAALSCALWACQMLLPAAEKEAGAPVPAPAARQTTPKPAPGPATPEPRPAPAPPPASPPAPPRPVAKPASPPPAPSPPAPSQPSPSQPAAADEAAFIAELESFEEKIAADSHAFELLGIPLDAGKKEVRRAWADLSKKYHPDSLKARGLTHLHDRVEAVFASLSEAQLVLGDKNQREELRKLVEAGGGKAKGAKDATAMARAAIESEMITKDADKLLKAGRFPDALEKYQQALALTPDEPDVQAALIWSEWNAAGQPADQAGSCVARLEEITREYPNIARAHYFRGLLLLRTGNDTLALGAFEEAHKANPRLVDAERQARAIKLKRNPPKPKPDKPKAQKSFLGKLFNK